MIQVIVRAMDILEFVAQQGNQPVQLIKIAEHVALSQSTTANIVKTLLQKDFLEQTSRKEGYRLGIASYRLTGNNSYDQDLILAAKAPIQELTKHLNETALLAQIKNNKRVILHMVECEQVLQVKTVIVADVYNTSTGRLLLAYFSQQELDNFIKAIGLPTKDGWPGAETKIGLTKELAKIREEEFVQVLSVYHTVGFAVPVYKNQKVIAGLSVFVPESRYTAAHKGKIFQLIKKAAKDISDRLGN